MTRRLPNLRRDDGQAFVEFALVLPILVALLLGIVQFGIIFNNYETMTDAARVGARKAATGRFIGDNGASGATAARSAASDLKQSDLGVDVQSCTPGTYPCSSSPGQDWSTPGNEVTVKVTYPYDIKILDIVVASGTITTVTKERLE
jgi:Flp pilus assembly protein TadG